MYICIYMFIYVYIYIYVFFFFICICYIILLATTWVAKRFRQRDGHNCQECVNGRNPGRGDEWASMIRACQWRDGHWEVAIDGGYKHVDERAAYCKGADEVGLTDENLNEVKNALKWNAFNALNL